jgi:hypothetical protein
MSTTVKPPSSTSISESKRHRHPHQPKVPDQYRTQVQQLQELFPNWSNDGLSQSSFYPSRPYLFLDLLSTLLEVGGDTTLAVTRITEGLYLSRITLSFH